MVAAVAADPARRLAQVRAWWRVRHPPPSLGQRLDVLYTAALVTAIFGALAYGTASSALAQVVTPDWLATYGPSIALLGALLTTHWGAYHGPVVFSVPDVAFLLGAPLPRRGLALRRLARALVAGALAGAVIAAGVLVGLAGEGRGTTATTAAGLVAGLAELGVLAVAGAWAVQRSARWERVARRAVWPAALAAAALAAASQGGGAGRQVALWSGPWGWAVQAGAGAGAWAAALAALSVATGVAAVAALRDCGHSPTERHMRRAEARQSAIASLAGFDARTARRVFEDVATRPRTRRRAGLRRPRSARLAIPWRDLVAARGMPGRVAEAVALAGGGTALAVAGGDRPLAVVASTLLVYAGAARILWPLRAELDVVDRVRTLLRPRSGQVLLAHTAVPIAVTTAAAAIAAAACALAGATPEPAVAPLAVAVTPALTLCAAMSARRGGRLPASVLTTAVAVDPSGGAGAILGWFALWPATAATIGSVALLLAANTAAGGALAAAGCAAAAAAALAAFVGADVDR